MPFLPLACNAVLARPNISSLMASKILLVRGSKYCRNWERNLGESLVLAVILAIPTDNSASAES